MKIQRELNTLRVTLQQERATVNALKRQIKRMKGKEVVESGRISDEERILDAFDSMPDDIGETRFLIKICQERMDVKRKRIAELKDQLDRRFPLTPCAVIKRIRKAWCNRKRIVYI